MSGCGGGGGGASRVVGTYNVGVSLASQIYVNTSTSPNINQSKLNLFFFFSLALRNNSASCCGNNFFSHYGQGWM